MTINFRVQPELYWVGAGEQGVLLIEPDKSEILTPWRLKTVAELSSTIKTRSGFPSTVVFSAS